MDLDARLSRLESAIPVKQGPKPDLSALTVEELRFLVAYAE